MKCPNCSHSDFTFYPDYHLAYFDRFFDSWAEAMVYTCSECGYSEMIHQPRGTVITNMGLEPVWVNSAQSARNSERNGLFAKAAAEACDFCRDMYQCLDIVWFAWALGLAEKSGQPGLITDARSLYVSKCREYRRAYQSREKFAYQKELLDILDNEIARLSGPMDNSNFR